MPIFVHKEQDNSYVQVVDNIPVLEQTPEATLNSQDIYIAEGTWDTPFGQICIGYSFEANPDDAIHPKIVPIFQDRPLDQVVPGMLEYLQARRYEVEQSGFTFMNMKFASDDRAQLKYLGIMMAAQAIPNYTVNFKNNDGEFVELNAQQVMGLAFAARDHVQGCFDHEAYIKGLITGATTIAELASINIDNGWPA